VADAANNARRRRAPWGLRSRVARAGGRRRLRNSLCVALHPQRTVAPARGYANDGPRNCDRRQWANVAVIGDGHCVALPCRHECLCGDDTNIQTVVLSGNPQELPTPHFSTAPRVGRMGNCARLSVGTAQRPKMPCRAGGHGSSLGRYVGARALVHRVTSAPRCTATRSLYHNSHFARCRSTPHTSQHRAEVTSVETPSGKGRTIRLRIPTWRSTRRCRLTTNRLR
jgi:hypothetical protein